MSVVIPTSNRPHLLERSVRSVLEQTMPPTRLIVVEDGGPTEATTRVIAEALVGTSITIEHLGSTGGACSARNVGLATATSPLIAFLDDDDWWRPRFLESCSDTLAAMEATGAVVTDIEIVASDGSTLHTAFLGSATECLYRNAGFTGQNAVFRTEPLRVIGGFDPSLRALHDRDLQLRLLRTGLTFDVVHEALAVVDHSHAMSRISTSDARAIGMTQFYRKWSPSAGPSIKIRMAVRTLISQRRSSNRLRRLVGNATMAVYIAGRRVVDSLCRVRRHFSDG